MKKSKELVRPTSKGLYCEAADVYIDPWKKVDRALITHGHSDHARRGSKHYLCSSGSVNILKHRLGKDISVEGLPYGQRVVINGVSVSFHPAGHVAGSAQVRVEYKGEVFVITGDYKTEDDGITEAFELVPCHSLITECTFGLPVYIWESQDVVMDRLHQWWSVNASLQKVSVITAYSLGKAQRLINALDPATGPIYCHPAIAAMNDVYRSSGFALKKTRLLKPSTSRKEVSGALLVVPPAALDSKNMIKLGSLSTAVASGWMALRGNRRRRGTDRGFVLSDHCDWPSLNTVVRDCGATRVWTTHGYTVSFARWLCDRGLDAKPLKTEYGENNIDDSDQ